MNATVIVGPINQEIIVQRTITSLAIVAVICLGVLVGRAGSINAHGTQPSPSCIDGVSVEPLARGLPSATDDMALMLLRVNFAPGGGIGLHTHPGSLILTIESGELGYTLQEGEVEVQRATTEGTPGPLEPLAVGEEATLQPGDALFEEGLKHTARNTGDVPAVVLVAGLMAADQAFTQCAEEA